jgi:hypothetical protein
MAQTRSSPPGVLQRLLWERLERGIPLIFGPRFPEENLSPRGFSGKSGGPFLFFVFFTAYYKKEF